MRIFVDTNILIDFLARREKFFLPAWSIVSRAKSGDTILVSALSFATASYILATHHKMTDKAINNIFDKFVRTCHITPIDSQTIGESLKSEFNDFEDAMQYYSALREQADVIITRNTSDYRASTIPVYEPQQFLDLLTTA